MEIQFHREGDEQRNRIYKYFGVGNTDEKGRLKFVKNLLETGELFFNNPKEFNDLFDSLLDYSFVGEDTDIAIWFREFFDSEDVDDNIKNQFRKILQSEEVNKYECAAFELKKHYKTSRYREENLMNARVCCFADSWNVSPMWGHYASSNSGICIGFEVEYVSRPPEGSFLTLDFQEPAPGGSGSTKYPLLPIVYKEVRPDPFKIFCQDVQNRELIIGQFLLTQQWKVLASQTPTTNI